MKTVEIDLAKIKDELSTFEQNDVEGMFKSMQKDFERRVILLTGDIACPFPSFLFAAVIISLKEDAIAKALILTRRQLPVDSFCNEPQLTRLTAIAAEYGLKMKFHRK